MRTLCAAVFTGLTLSAVAFGQTYVAWEGDTFPEQDGWDGYTRIDPLSTRYIQDGVFTIDAPANADRSDYTRNIQLESDRVYYEWSARMSTSYAWSAMDIKLRSGTLGSDINVVWRSGSAQVRLLPSGVFPGIVKELSITPGVFHTYRAESDGPLYTVYIDGIPVLSAEMQPPNGFNATIRICSLNDYQRVASRSEWDYFRVGELPEPTALLMLASGFVLLKKRPGRPA